MNFYFHEKNKNIFFFFGQNLTREQEKKEVMKRIPSNLCFNLLVNQNTKRLFNAMTRRVVSGTECTHRPKKTK